jgi:hypothetical protein
MHHQRRYPDTEYTRIEGQPLSPARLAAIQRALPEHERFGFFLALTEEIADQVLAATIKTAPAPTGKEKMT